jgi:hypothetical protein
MKKSLVLVILLSTVAAAQTLDWQSVETTLGRKGTVQGGVLKVAFPRSDLNVQIDGVLIDPNLALTSWIAFKKAGKQTMIMGDIVLLDSEVTPAMSLLIGRGLEVSALHNHILGESPNVKYMHFSGHGDANRLADAIKAVLALTGTPLESPSITEQASTFDWSKVESILGLTGQRKGKVIQFGIPRAETIRENQMEVPPFMGMAIGINLQAVGERAATTGDFVLVASEVNPVVKVLTDFGIAVTAIHNHMLAESPRLFFLHFWGVGQPDRLARGLRAALDKTNTRKNK